MREGTLRVSDGNGWDSLMCRCVPDYSPDGEFRFQWMVLRWSSLSSKIPMIPPPAKECLHSQSEVTHLSLSEQKR